MVAPNGYAQRGWPHGQPEGFEEGGAVDNNNHDERAAMAAIEALRELYGDAKEQVARADAARERYRGLPVRDAWAWGEPWIDDEDRERTARLHAAQRTLAVLTAAVVAMRRRYGANAVGIYLGPDDDPPMRAVLGVAVPPADDRLVATLAGAELRRGTR